MHVLAPIYCLFVGDGSTVAFTLDLAKDAYYFENHVTFNTNVTRPTINFKPPAADSYAVGAFKCQANDVQNDNDLGNQGSSTMSVSTTQNQVTFTLNSAPSSGEVFAIFGFIEYA